MRQHPHDVAQPGIAPDGAVVNDNHRKGQIEQHHRRQYPLHINDFRGEGLLLQDNGYVPVLEIGGNHRDILAVLRGVHGLVEFAAAVLANQAQNGIDRALRQLPVGNQLVGIAVHNAEGILVQPVGGLEQILQVHQHHRVDLGQVAAGDVQRANQHQIVFLSSLLHGRAEHPRCDELLTEDAHPFLIADAVGVQTQIIEAAALAVFGVGHHGIRLREIEEVGIPDAVVDDIRRNLAREQVVVIPGNIVVALCRLHLVDGNADTLHRGNVAQQPHLLIQPDTCHIQLNPVGVLKVIPQHIHVPIAGRHHQQQGNQGNYKVGQAPAQEHPAGNPLFLFRHIQLRHAAILRFFGLLTPSPASCSAPAAWSGTNRRPPEGQPIRRSASWTGEWRWKSAARGYPRHRGQSAWHP